MSVRECSFSGSLSSEVGRLRRLRLLSGWQNDFSGTLPTEMFALASLEVLTFGRNDLRGQLPLEVGSLSKLRELFLQTNRFMGRVPSEISRLTSDLAIVVLDTNGFQGSLPNITPLQGLHALTLHNNRFSGLLTHISHTPVSLGLLTLHNNRFMGTVPAFSLWPWCSDSASFSDSSGWGCEEQDAHDCKDAKVLASCPRHCAGFDGEEPTMKDIVVTLHRNVLSCRLPSAISKSANTVNSVVLLGNLFDDPLRSDVDWVSSQEARVHFLFNKQQTWLAWVCGAGRGLVVIPLLLLFFRYSLGKDGYRIAKTAFTNTDDSVVILHRAVLWDAVPGSIIASLGILPLCFAGSYGYYTCGHKVARLTMSYFGGSPISEIIAAVSWSIWSCFAISFVMRITTVTTTRTSTFSVWERPSVFMRILMWPVWLMSLTLLSFPAFVYCITQTLPRNNALFDRLGAGGVTILFTIHKFSPLLTNFVNFHVLPTLTAAFSYLMGSHRIRLALQLYTSTSWLIVTFSVILLHENCAGGWKSLWNICKHGGTDERMLFDEILGTEVILDTKRDICHISFRGILDDDRCPRAIVDVLGPLLLGSCAIWAFLSPLSFLMMRHLRYKFGCPLPKGPGKWSRNGDIAKLARVVDVSVVWGALLPCVVPLGCVAILTQLVVVQVKARDRGSYSSAKDDLRLSFLRGHLICSTTIGLGLQLWFAFATGIHGRSVLTVILSITYCLGVFLKIDVWKVMSKPWRSCQPENEFSLGQIELSILRPAENINPNYVESICASIAHPG